jgi:hypothetical protein
MQILSQVIETLGGKAHCFTASRKQQYDPLRRERRKKEKEGNKEEQIRKCKPRTIIPAHPPQFCL